VTSAAPLSPTGETVLALLREGAGRGEVRIRVQGSCMSPGIEPGDVVAVRRARWLWPGDVVVFLAADGRLTVHRALGYRPGRKWHLLTQADRAAGPDRAVPLERVVGRVVSPSHASFADRVRAAGLYAARALAALRRRALDRSSR